jgi:membrane-associated phospholipid phosphatase
MGRPIARVLTRRRRRILAICAGLAAGIGMIGIGGHWVSDVLAGWPLGAAVYILALRFPPSALADTPELIARPAGASPAWRNPYAEPD